MLILNREKYFLKKRGASFLSRGILIDFVILSIAKNLLEVQFGLAVRRRFFVPQNDKGVILKS